MPSRRSQTTGGKDRAWNEFAARVLDARAVWCVAAESELLGAEGLDGSAAQPCWSSPEAARAMVDSSASTSRTREITIVQISLAEYITQHLPGLAERRVLVGIDWGTDRHGWVLDPTMVQTALRALVHQRLN